MTDIYHQPDAGASPRGSVSRPASRPETMAIPILAPRRESVAQWLIGKGLTESAGQDGPIWSAPGLGLVEPPCAVEFFKRACFILDISESLAAHEMGLLVVPGAGGLTEADIADIEMQMCMALESLTDALGIDVDASLVNASLPEVAAAVAQMARRVLSGGAK